MGAVAAVALAAGALPGAAGAAVSCDLGGGLLEVALSASEDTVSIGTDAGAIEVADQAGDVACAGGAPTTSNTNTISIHNDPGLTDNFVAILGADQLVPGLNPEPGDDEIEVFVNLNEGERSTLAVSLSLGLGGLFFGTAGINANATDGEDQPDADIFQIGPAERLIGQGSPGPDLISGGGGRGTGSPMTTSLLLGGESGDDVVLGGDAGDLLAGNDGEDTISGFAGGDLLTGGKRRAMSTPRWPATAATTRSCPARPSTRSTAVRARTFCPTKTSEGPAKPASR